MWDDLNADAFPLKAIGTLIYSRNQSSPVLTACTPKMAEQTVAFLNDYAALKMKAERDGPTLVVPNGAFNL